MTWEAVNTQTCCRHPESSWLSFARGRGLTQVAAIFVSMPATAGMVNSMEFDRTMLIAKD